ncbi:MAG TPA: amidohydrolase family protein [Spirochaetia bacterium]|nr:amidohydrolase family protein [Spirochaetia bacterium]
MKPRELPSFMDFRPTSRLKRPAHVPARARFPVIDAHNHLFANMPAEEMVAVMDAAGVKLFMNLTGNCELPFDDKGYTIRRRDFDVFRREWMDRAPGRFAAFTMAEFARWDDFAIDLDRGFAEQCVTALQADVRTGALGLKVTKELGLRFHDPKGAMIAVDDPRLYPVWKKAGELGIPVLIHTSDPVAFFHPVDADNEHYPTLLTYPGWSFHGSHFSKEELLEQRTRMMADHPGTTFICAHVANNPEDLDWVSSLLERLPNVNLDFSARMDELGRQPYSARDFFIRWQDRILFGADMPISVEMYRAYFRFLETRDEYFDYPGYVGETTNFCRWKIYGLGLPDNVLQKVYAENALRLIPGLAEVMR